MNGNRHGVRSLLCLTLCAVLVTGSFIGSDFIAPKVQNIFKKYSDTDTVGSVLSVNMNSATHNSDVSAIVGYGGGDYAVNTVSNTPTDIETLKEQAEIAFKNYKKSGNIEEKQMGATSKTVKYGNLKIDNKTFENISVKNLLSETPSYGTVTKDKPYILIYHTHSTEGYEMLDLGWYSDDYNSRTADKSKNMVRVGDELTKTLQEAGYNVIHDRNIYDTSYNGAYARSRVSVDKYLKQYPSVAITLDVHRDAIHYESGTKCKPTAVIDGKKAAQVMIISGCEGDGVENFSSWKENLTFALNLQSAVEEKNSGLMRPIFFCNRKYNMDATPCSLLLEFGTDANTLEEAVYSAQLMGESLAGMLDKQLEK